MVTKPGDITYSLSPASGGEGWGEGGKTTACNFLTGQRWDLGGFKNQQTERIYGKGYNFLGKWSGWKKGKPRTLSPGFTPDAAFVA